MIYPIVCAGCHLYEADENDIVTVPYTESDKTEGWMLTSHQKFSMDKKSVWICPSCTKRWNEERQAKIEKIINLAITDMTEKYFWHLWEVLQILDATQQEKDKFSSSLFPERKNVSI